MAEYTPSIQELHRTLTRHHRYHGGKILQAYGLRTRVIETRTPTGYTAWGADYYPAGLSARRMLRLTPRTVDWRYAGQDPIGIPNAVPCEAWVSFARATKGGRTSLARFEYDAGTWELGGDTQRVLVSTTQLPVAIGELALNDMRGGIGFSRSLPLDFEPATSDQQIELRSALMSVIATCISLASASP